MGILDQIHQNVVKPIGKALGFITYQQNDPTTPELNIAMTLPPLPNPCPPFGVQGFTGAEGTAGSLEAQAADLYITMVLSLTYVQGVLQRPIIRWPALTKLIANPRAGKMFNAYYDRYYLNFFYDKDPATQQTIYTCESTDVVSHELGHAILDSLRPDLWAVQSVEIQAFHEAFGDINAITAALTMPNMVSKALTETNNDLKNDNVIANLAEQMGMAIFHAMGGTPGDRANHSLRNANNKFVYTIPEALPTRAPADQLAGEPHSFSRVFSGAWYDTLVNIYNAERTAGKTPNDALISARDKLAKVTYNAIKFAPISARFFQNVLNAMIGYDSQQSVGIGDAIKAGFGAHGLIPAANFTMVDLSEPEPVQKGIVGGSDTETARISDFTGNKNNPLYGCIVELANSTPIDDGKNMADITNLRMAINAAQHSLQVLSDNNRVSEGPSSGIHEKEFSVIDGRLVRNYFCCAFHR